MGSATAGTPGFAVCHLDNLKIQIESLVLMLEAQPPQVKATTGTITGDAAEIEAATGNATGAATGDATGAATGDATGNATCDVAKGVSLNITI